ncbi:hypothetical protein [Bowmanella denitrificans]|uniref:hypothetical protein n=1 Tax=Bowmanella denitrificans TaxID=366582 RepID=UPI00155891F0|nr:hypothetical protein [Bowmanella denitrificans]
MNAPKKQTHHIGSVKDLRTLLASLPSDIDGLETLYQVNVYHAEDTDEKWLEIEPAN